MNGQPQDNSRARTAVHLAGDISGGLMSAVVALPTTLVVGILVFAPLGPKYMTAGVMAGLLGAAVVSIVSGLLGGAPNLVSGGRSAMALVMAGVLGSIMTLDILPADHAGHVQLALVLMFLSIVLAGVIQVGIGVMGMGQMIKYLPHAVISGLMNGLALIIIVKQVPVIFWAPDMLTFLGRLGNPATLVSPGVGAALASGVIIVLLKKYWPRSPAMFIGVVVGAVAHNLFLGSEGTLGQIASTPGGLSLPDVSLIGDGEWTWALAATTTLAVGGAALTLAFLGSVLSLLGSVAVDLHTNDRHDGNRELIGQGLANIAAGLVGGLGGGGAAARSIAACRAGAKTKWASVFHGLTFLAILLVGQELFALLPLQVLAVALVLLAVDLVDTTELWEGAKLLVNKGDYPPERIVPSVVISLAVTMVTLSANFVIAIGIGLVGASLMFAARMQKIIIRACYSGKNIRSKTARPQEAFEILLNEGDRIAVLEAQGPIFFGSADQLVDEVETSLADRDYVIIDFKSANEIDDTAVKILRRLDERMAVRGKTLLLSYLHPDNPLWEKVSWHVADWSLFQDRVFPDTDAALSYAEEHLLQEAGASWSYEEELPLAEISLFKDMKKADIKKIEPLLHKICFNKGQWISREGDPADEMFFVAAGIVSVFKNIGDGDRMVRLAAFRPGVVFGEMGPITGLPRTTDLRADEPVSCYVLDKSSYDQLLKDEPRIVYQIMRGISMELASRLRRTSAHVGELERRG